MLNIKLKISFLMAIFASVSLYAQDYQVEDVVPEQSQSTEPQEATSQLSVAKNVEQSTKTMLEDNNTDEKQSVETAVSTDDSPSSDCPADFYTLPLYPNAKFCQSFADKPPASLSYFAVSDQQTAKNFYLDKLGQAEDEKMLKGRIVLQYASGDKVVIISKDGQGSQIDILVKSAG